MEKDILEKAGALIKKDQGINLAALTHQEKTILIDALRPKFKLTELLTFIHIPKSSYCYDNACIESFHSIIKKELIHHERYKTRSEATMSILEYIVSFYNYERSHGYLNYLSPMTFEKMYA